MQRFFRLFPLYLFSIGLVFLLYQTTGMVPAEQIPGGISAWLINLTMLQEFLRVPHVNGVFWTLTLELVLYAGFAVLHGFGWLNRCRTITILGIVGLLVAGSVVPLVLERRVPAGYALLLVTALLGSAYQRYEAGKLTRGTLITFGISLTATAAIVYFINFHFFRREGQPLNALAGVTSWIAALVVFSVAFRASAKPMPAAGTFLGRISYSVYLLHGLILLIVPRSAGIGVYLAGSIGLTILLSTLTYFGIEKPFQTLGKKLTARRPTIEGDAPNLSRAA